MYIYNANSPTHKKSKPPPKSQICWSQKAFTMNKMNKSKNPVHTFHQVPQNNVPAQSPCRFVLNVHFRWPLAADVLNPFFCLLLYCESCRHERAKSAQPTRKKTSLSAGKILVIHSDKPALFSTRRSKWRKTVTLHRRERKITNMQRNLSSLEKIID